MILLSSGRFLNINTLLLSSFLLFSYSATLAQSETDAFELLFLSEDVELRSYGELKDGQKFGMWVFTSQDSTFLQGGNYTESGVRTGFWKIFIKGVERARMHYRNDTLDGDYILFHPNRVAAVNTQFKNGQLNGEWTSYTSNHERYEKGNFENGKKAGIWKTYFPGGQTEIVSSYKLGLLDSAYLQYDPWGDLVIKTNYTNGQLNGDWLKQENGNVLEEGQFVNGVRDGKWQYYEFIGSFASIVEFYNKGKRTGKWTSYHPNRRKASETTYVDDKPVGVGRTWHSNKQLASETRYRLGLEDSTYTEYFKDGSVAVTGVYDLGVKKGTWKYYHPNGLIQEIGSFVNDLRSGNWKTFSEEGRLIAEGRYRLDLEVGQWFNYYNSGSLESIGSFKLGEKDGLWGYFHKDGQSMVEERWQVGKLLSVTDFTDSKGETHSSGSITNGTGGRIHYYPGGKKYSEGYYRDGLPNGNWKFYDEKERLLMSGKLVNGVKEGEWLVFSRSGVAVRVETFVNGEMVDSSYR